LNVNRRFLKIYTPLASAAVMALSVPWVAFADDVTNNLDASIDSTYEVLALNAGATSPVTFSVNATKDDGKNGCNLTGQTSLTVAVNSSNPAVATVSPSSLMFDSCGATKSVTVTARDQGSTNVSLSQISNDTGATFNFDPARFTVNVTAPAPANTAPKVSVTGVAAGGAYEKGQVPAAACLVDDMEDGTSSFAASLSAVTNAADPLRAAFGLGSQTATCSYTDHGGLTTVAQATYIISDTLKPTISLASRTAANANGWNKGPVDVKFSCVDNQGGSGIAGCGPDETLQSETPATGQFVMGVATDNGGNASDPLSVGPIKIDLQAPTVNGTASPAPNANGWNNGDVTIAWSAQDGLSGVDPAIQPAASVVKGEGRNLGAGPVSMSDLAGNTGSASVTGIKIDRMPPVLTGATVTDAGQPRSPEGAGWFSSAVRVHFTATDPKLADGSDGSGVASQAEDVVLSHDGANQKASGTAVDYAGNQGTGELGGINIDSKAPSSKADISCTGKNGFCRGNANGNGTGKATVVLTATDQPGLSGVKEIHAISNGKEQVTQGTSASMDVNLNGSGKSHVDFYAVDNAGNKEPLNGVDLKYDTIAPTVDHTLNPNANAAGWNKSDLVVHFTAVDDKDGSGVDPSTVTPDMTIETETASQVVTGSAEDLAGNLGTDSLTVKLDKTAPTITGKATTAPNANGWYNSAVTVHFDCKDQGPVQSGIATCESDTALSAQGADQAAMGTAVDKADNTASTTVSGINIDSIEPTIVSVAPANGSVFVLGQTPTPTCVATDSGSGLDGACSVTVTGGTANGVGKFSYTATAKDKAGNVSTATGTYTVQYDWDGFLQPINDTAHQIGETTSIFKGGSTVPVKFQLKKADGSVVQASSLPTFTGSVKGSATTAPVIESSYTDPATAGNVFGWDLSSQQYIYNWSTKGLQTGYYYRVGVALDDGQTYYVNVGLR
jgi:hypothetical protein